MSSNRVDFSYDPNDFSLKAIYRLVRLCHNHCYFHGRLKWDTQSKAIEAMLTEAICNQHDVYDAANFGGVWYRETAVNDKYADGKWIAKVKRDLAFAREYANKYNKVTSVTGIKIYPDITLKG